MRKKYLRQMVNLNISLLEMGDMVQEIIQTSVEALTNQDLEKAKKVFTLDNKIDELELQIEEECMKILALQHPMAKDLRVIGTIIKIITDLERMGDHAVNIADITLKIGKEPLIKPLIDIPKMAELTQKMVRKSLDAFMSEDIKLAREVALDDEEVDKLYEYIYTELLQMMIQKTQIINQATHLLFIGRFLERISDHATNIGERVIYMVTGDLIEIN